MLRENVEFNVHLLVGLSAAAGLLGLLAVLFGFIHGAWIVLLGLCAIAWARAFRAEPPNRLSCGAATDAKMRRRLPTRHSEAPFLRRVTDSIAPPRG